MKSRALLVGFALLAVLLTVCSAVSVHAALTDSLFENWNLSSKTGRTGAYNFGDYNGACTLATGKGKIGDAYNCSGPALTVTIPGTGSATYETCFWANQSSLTVGRYMLWRDGTGFGVDYGKSDTSNVITISTGSGAANQEVSTNGSVTANSYNFYCFQFNRQNNTIAVDVNAGRLRGSRAVSWGGTRTDVLYYGAANGAPGNPVLLDEVSVWNRSLTAAERTTLYNAGAGVAYPFNLAPGVPSWVAPTPSDGYADNVQATLNASCGAGERVFLWLDNQTTPTTLVLNNATTGNYTTSLTGGTYYYRAGCWANATGFGPNSTVRSYTYDDVAPSITLRASNEFNRWNYTNAGQSAYDRSVPLNITFVDDHQLYGMSVNITRAGVVYFNASNESLSGLQYNYSRTLDASAWPVGYYTAELMVSDSHTAREIRPYGVQKANRRLTFVTAEGNLVEIESAEDAVTDAYKQLDRYEFSYEFTTKGKKSRTFDVRADKPITYLPQSTYKAHFVVSNGWGGNWLDFEGVPGTPVVERVTDRHYRVTFEDLADSVRFQSIGGLNVLAVNYTFYVGNYSTAAAQVAVGETGTLYLNVTMNTTIQSVQVDHWYNGTYYAGGNTTTCLNPDPLSSPVSVCQVSRNMTAPGTAGNASILWNVTVTQFDGNSSNFLVNASQVVYDWSLVACGSPAVLRFSLFNEEAPAQALNGTLNLEIVYWVTNRSLAKTYNTSFSAASSFSVCINPASSAIRADVYAQYTTPGGFTHRFYVQNGSYSNVSTNYSLYNTNTTTGYSDLKLTTRYVTNYGYFKNVYTHLQRKYLSEGVWRTVQMDRSGDYGLLFFDIKEENTDYKLLFYDENNQLLKETDSLKFVCTAGVCDLTQLLDPAGTQTPSSNATATATYDNATKVITVSWSSQAATGSVAVITVVKEGFSNSTSICSVTQTGMAGTYACNVSVYTGALQVFVDVDGENQLSTWVTVERPGLGQFVDQAEGALWTFIIMVVVMAFGLFSPVGVVISGVFGLIVVYFLGIFTALTVSFILVAVVVGVVIAVKVRT